MEQDGQPPVWFWIIAILALLWNGLGLAAYVADITMSADDYAQLTLEQQKLYANRPYWASAAFAVAVIAGFLGSVMLLLRKPIAVRLFLLSLIAVLIQFGSYFILDGYMDYLNQTGWIMPITIPVVSLAFFLFARWAEKDSLLK
ncbi:hypothetical protein [Parasphingorhabdus sp.]|uniref:hypothetical protein n=1 Tax=Parasphingorhabdus sp. TaxID=2709688 RepID=UPI002F93F0A9